MNRVEAINIFAIPVVTYSFNTVNWAIPDFTKMNKKIQNFLLTNKMHHLKADVVWIYVSRRDGGKEIIPMEMTPKITIEIHKYLSTTKDWMPQLVFQHDNRKKSLSIKTKKHFPKITWYSNWQQWSGFMYHAGKRNQKKS